MIFRVDRLILFEFFIFLIHERPLWPGGRGPLSLPVLTPVDLESNQITGQAELQVTNLGFAGA